MPRMVILGPFTYALGPARQRAKPSSRGRGYPPTMAVRTSTPVRLVSALPSGS